jgi:predicted dehydrogenase
MNRRKFVRNVSFGALGASILNGGWTLEALAQTAQKRVSPSDEIGIGVIGPGSRGQELMRNFLRVPGVRIRALADIYQPRFAQARRLTKEETPAYTDYRKLLERKDLDAIIVASPLYLHREHVVAALESGRHVFGEKSMGYALEHCDKIVDAVRRSGKHFQVGHQYRYAPWFREAVRRINEGEIGEVKHIYGYWHRNNNWRRPIPDPKFERLINWRLYKEYSQGLMAELGSHQIDIANWVFGSMPESVTANGGIDFWKDGRETNDNVQAIFRYPGGRTFVFSSLLENHKVGNQQWIYGSKGSVELTLEDGTFYYERDRNAPATPTPSTAEVVERGVVTGATYSPRGDMPYRGPGAPIKTEDGSKGNPNYLQCESFIESLRANQRPFADEKVGWASAVSVVLANRAIEEGRRLKFDEHVKISSAG